MNHLPFANVLIKGTTTGVTSDIDGYTKLKILAQVLTPSI